MSAQTWTLRTVATSRGAERPRWAAVVVTCAAIDAMAAGIVLFETPLPRALDGIAAAALHVMAALLLSALLRAQDSRRWMCVAALLAVPCVGAAVPVAVLGTRGRGTAAIGLGRRPRRRAALRVAVTPRLVDTLSPCDALDSGDEEQRRAALSSLARRSDPEAIALLRWAARGRDPDLALLSALALDEIGERAERHQLERTRPAGIRRAAH